MLKIGNKSIGGNNPTFIIAEAGVNHNGDFVLAKKLIDAAASAKADAVKFQTFDPNTLVTKSAKRAEYQHKNIGGKETQYAMLARLQLKRKYHAKLKQYAEKKGLIFLSTPFSIDDAEFLFKLGVSAFKVGSTDANNSPHLKFLAKKGLPIILSTGMSTLAEIKESVALIRKNGNKKIIVLHCTSNYPAAMKEINLRAMLTMQKELGTLIGYSDHTLGIEVSIAAVALGAQVIEKHFTLDKKMPGPDHKASLEPTELAQMITSIRNVSCALGSGKKAPTKSEIAVAKVARKSIVASRSISAGEIIRKDDITLKRPGTGLAPKFFDEIVGRRTKKDIYEDELITWRMID